MSIKGTKTEQNLLKSFAGESQARSRYTFFADDPIYKLEMLTELIYRDARRLTDAGIQAILYRKIIELYEVIDIRSQEFSMDRMNRTTELKQWLTTYEYKS